jgi:predicted HicB family RNase H-like nuclease
MALKNDHYTYRVTWSENDNKYAGLCAEFPSLSWLAQQPEAALKGVRDLVAEVVKDMQKNSEKVPQPLAEKNYSGKFMVRVPPEIHRELAIQAAESDTFAVARHPDLGQVAAAGQQKRPPEDVRGLKADRFQ